MSHQHSKFNVTGVDHAPTGSHIHLDGSYGQTMHVIRLRPNRVLNPAEQFYYRRVLRAYIWRHWMRQANQLLIGEGGVTIPDLRTLAVVQVSEDPDSTETSLLVTYDHVSGIPPEWACRMGVVLRGEDPYEQMAQAAARLVPDDPEGEGPLLN